MTSDKDYLEKEDITLLDDGLDILQKKDGFRFGIDAVLLAEFFNGKNKNKILEIGSGSGIISILLAKEGYKDIKTIEIQKEMAELTKRNIRRCNFEESISVQNIDIKELKEGNTYDSIISNPPYMKIDGKKLNNSDTKSISRHEITLNLDELIETSKRLLKPRGSIFIVHRSYRIGEILVSLEKNKFSPKRIKFIYSDNLGEARLVLIEASKGRKEILSIEKPIYLNERIEKEDK